MNTQTIAIIGLGRLGASLGLALKASSIGSKVKIIGHDRDRAVANKALKAGMVDETLVSVRDTAAAADILILAEPYTQLLETVKLIAPDIQAHTVMIDTSPLKKPVQKSVDQHWSAGHYVACQLVIHPDQLHDTRYTIDAADVNLFRNSVLCLMPGPKVDQEAVNTAATLGQLVGGSPFYIDPGEYDAYAQALETIPNLLAAALFRAVTKSQAWRDMVRFAGTSFATTTSVLGQEADAGHMAFQDKTATLRWLDSTITELLELRRWVSEGNEHNLGDLLTELNIQRDEWLHARRQNNWNDTASTPSPDSPGMMQQMFGIFGRSNKPKDKK